MKSLVQEQLDQILCSSSSSEDFQTYRSNFSSLRKFPLTVISKQQLETVACKSEDDSSVSSNWTDMSGESLPAEPSGLARKERIVDQIVANALKDTSSSSEEGSVAGQGEMCVAECLRSVGSPNKLSLDHTKSRSKHSVQGARSTVHNVVGREGSNLINRLQVLSQQLKGEGELDSSSENSVTDDEQKNTSYSNYSIRDCKQRLEFLIAKLDSLTHEKIHTASGRKPQDNFPLEEKVLHKRSSDATASTQSEVPTTAFGSLQQTNAVRPREENINEASDEVQNPSKQAKDCSHEKTNVPAADFSASDLKVLKKLSSQESKLDTFSTEQLNEELVSKSRKKRRSKSKKKPSHRRTFRGVVQHEILPRIRVARTIASIPKAKLTKALPQDGLLNEVEIKQPAVSASLREQSASHIRMQSTQTQKKRTTSEQPDFTSTVGRQTMNSDVNRETDLHLKRIKKGREVHTSEKNKEKERQKRKKHDTNANKRSTEKSPSVKKQSTSKGQRSRERTDRGSLDRTTRAQGERKYRHSSRQSSRKVDRSRSDQEKQTQCLDLLLSDHEPVENNEKEEDPTISKTNHSKSQKKIALDTSAAQPRPLKKLGSLFFKALRRNDSIDTGDIVQTTSSTRKNRVFLSKNNIFGDTWRKTKSALDSVLEKRLNGGSAPSRLFSFFHTSKAGKSALSYRNTI